MPSARRRHQLVSLGKAGYEIGLVCDRVKNVPDEELARPGLVKAKAAGDVGTGRKRPGDHLRRVALRADQSAVGDHLDPVTRDTPFVANVGGAHLALARKRRVLERVEVKGHCSECRVLPRVEFRTLRGAS